MLKLNIQMFADGKVVIDTELNTKNFENGLDKIKSTTQRAGSTIKNIVVGLGITKLISAGMNQITGSIDGAISRLDTLNQFPKVMENLGIASDEAEESIKKMSDKLAGLPTTLDDGARAVQRFTSKNGNVKKSTDLFLALNNAILAGGASSEIQASALEQLSQAYAKGKPDMMEWRTAMTAMPAQLKQVAKAMGYIDADQLGEALRNGTVSMDEFMDTITKLNTEGVDGFLSFEKQARNSTGGIRTAITVAKTQVVKGVADIIQALNTKIGEGGIGSYISKLGEDAKKVLDTLAKLLTGEINPEEFGNLAINLINIFLQKFNEQLPLILNTGLEIVLNLIRGISQGISQLVENILQIPITIIETIKSHFDEIVDTGGELLIKFAEGIGNKLPDLAIEIEKLSDFIVQKLEDPEFINKIVEIGTKIVISMALGMIKALPHLIQAKQNIQGEINYLLLSLPRTMFELGKQMLIGMWNGFKSQFGAVKANIENSVSSIVKSVKKKLKIFSPSRVFRDEVGAMMAEGIGVGFDDSLSDVYKDMSRAIDIEQAKLQANVETGRVFNTLQNTTPVVMNINAEVEMDSQKVGRIVTPVVTRTIKNGGGV